MNKQSVKRSNAKKKDRMKKQIVPPVTVQTRPTPNNTRPERTKNKKSVFLVETLLSFRYRYLVNAECADYAADDVVMNEGLDAPQPEWQQKYLGETIIQTRPVTDADILTLERLDGDADGSPWISYTKFVWNNE